MGHKGTPLMPMRLSFQKFNLSTHSAVNKTREFQLVAESITPKVFLVISLGTYVPEMVPERNNFSTHTSELANLVLGVPRTQMEWYIFCEELNSSICFWGKAFRNVNKSREPGDYLRWVTIGIKPDLNTERRYKKAASSTLLGFLYSNS